MRYLHTNAFLTQKLLKYSRENPDRSYKGVPCREYQRSKRAGYGRMWNGLKLEDTHVMSFRLFKEEPLPEGHDVLHHCDNPACWEPSHLWSGTQADNNRDRDAKGRGGAHKNRGRKYGPSPLRGAAHKRAKLTEAQAREIISLKGLAKGTHIAARMSVSESLVYNIWKGRGWSWLTSV